VFSGYIGDMYHNKTLALIGYSASFFYKIFLILSAWLFGVLIARINDRTEGYPHRAAGALVAQSTTAKSSAGRLGLHKMLDMAGSSFGVGFCLFFITAISGSIKRICFHHPIIPATGILIIWPSGKTKAVKRPERVSWRE
jgi:hypothetical protein